MAAERTGVKKPTRRRTAEKESLWPGAETTPCGQAAKEGESTTLAQVQRVRRRLDVDGAAWRRSHVGFRLGRGRRRSPGADPHA